MMLNWLFAEFTLDITDQVTVGVDPGALSSGQKTTYYVDEGKNAYQLLVIHAKEIDPAEIEKRMRISKTANRKLVVIFHTNHRVLVERISQKITKKRLVGSNLIETGTEIGTDRITKEIRTYAVEGME